MSVHTSLVSMIQEHSHEAHHVVYSGCRAGKITMCSVEFGSGTITFVTNNAVDLRRLYSHVSIHAGLVIAISNVVPAQQES